ncbi:hypothetical protein CEXT_228091 [Caerostris extrusa]|uniref:Uncharacterized protein n=1 Tax=Caerostris extrusa TaxID=172846 RepID=A0AAV4TPG3_CAEEX|nr:hypothetical protein CEXT_228091 [Caerostris extrusa]
MRNPRTAQQRSVNLRKHFHPSPEGSTKAESRRNNNAEPSLIRNLAGRWPHFSSPGRGEIRHANKKKKKNKTILRYNINNHTGGQCPGATGCTPFWLVCAFVSRMTVQEGHLKNYSAQRDLAEQLRSRY